MSTPIPIKVTRWKCPHCSRSRSSRAATTEHISRCWLNPDARSCKTCDNYEMSSGRCDDYYCNCPPAEESCYAGVSLADGLVVGCERWTPAEDGER